MTASTGKGHAAGTLPELVFRSVHDVLVDFSGMLARLPINLPQYISKIHEMDAEDAEEIVEHIEWVLRIMHTNLRHIDQVPPEAVPPLLDSIRSSLDALNHHKEELEKTFGIKLNDYFSVEEFPFLQPHSGL